MYIHIYTDVHICNHVDSNQEKKQLFHVAGASWHVYPTHFHVHLQM